MGLTGRKSVMTRWPLEISLIWALLITVIALIASSEVLGAVLAGAFVGFVIYVPLALLAWLFGRLKPARSRHPSEAKRPDRS